MRETKITAFLLGTTILYMISVPGISADSTTLKTWITNVNAGTSGVGNTYKVTDANKDQVIIPANENGQMVQGGVVPLQKGNQTYTIDGDSILDATIKGTIAYYPQSNNTGSGKLVVRNVGGMKSGVDYTNIESFVASNVSGYIQNLTKYLKSDSTIKDPNGNNLDVSSAPAVFVYDAGLSASNNVFYGSSTEGANSSGKYDFGGAIVVKNDLDKTVSAQIQNNIFIDNSSQGNGGGVNIDGNILLNLTGNTFSGNKAVGSTTRDDERSGHGGALDFSGTKATLSGNKFYRNTANEMGGAIFIHNGSELTSTGDTFLENEATTQNGGAILNAGKLTIDDGEFVSNKASNATRGNGGAISNDFLVDNPEGANNASAGYGILKVTNTVFQDNEAKRKGGAVSNNNQMESEDNTYYSNMADWGGAISNAVGDSKKAEADNETNNKVFDPQKAVLTSTDDTFEHNHAGQAGGAIYSAGNVVMGSEGKRILVKSEATLTNVTLTDNTAGYRGGAIYNAGDMIINGGSITNNATNADTDGGGAINNDVIGFKGSETGPVVGLAVGNLTVSGVTFSENESQNSGGAVQNTGTFKSSGNTYSNNSSKGGGAITNETSSLTNIQIDENIKKQTGQTGVPTGTLTSTNDTFQSNTATEKGGAIYNIANATIGQGTFTGNQVTGANGKGGAIYNSSNATITGGSFSSNKASGTSGQGGAIYSSGTLKINQGSQTNTTNQTTFTSNTATGQGGAIYTAKSADVVGTTFSKNEANKGGAIYQASGTSAVKNSAFAQNKATGTSGQGGAIHNASGTVNVNNVSFQTNSATTSGGAIHNATNATIGQGTFTGNEVTGANGQGGAIYNAGNTTVTGGSFSSNKASGTSSQGGAIYNADGTVSVNNVSFQTNSATASGGAIYNSGRAELEDIQFSGNSAASGGAIVHAGTEETEILFVKKGTFTQNTATGQGGAIAIESGVASVQTGSSFVSNTATNQGGAVYIKDGEITISGSLLSKNETTATSGTVQGGAIANASGGKLNTKDGTKFSGNSTSGAGGAIYNAGMAHIENTQFVTNSAGTGGAIHNKGTVTIKNAATSQFAGNKATNGGSAIYNEAGATVNIEGAKDTIDLDFDPYYSQSTTNSGHPAPANKVRLFADNEDIVNKGTLNIKNSHLQLHHSSNLAKGVINIDKSKTGTVNVTNSRIDVGKSKIYGDTININSGSELLTHVSTKNPSEFGGLEANKITVSDQDTSITIRVKAGEHMEEAGSREYKILNAGTLDVVDNTGFATITKNHMYDIQYKGDGVYELTKVRPICPNGGCVHNAWVESEGEMEGHQRAQEIRELLNRLAQDYGCESKIYRDALDGIAPDVSPLIQAQSTEITQRLHGIISKQLYASMERTGYIHRGKRFYRFPERKSRFWVQGIYGQSEYAADKGFDMDTEGVAVGFDKYVARDTKLGLAYSYATSSGTAVQRDTDVTSHTIAVYGEYNPDRFYSNWLALYTRSSYEENKKVYTERVKAEYDVDVLGGQIMFGHKMGPFVVGDWASGVLSPEIGLRYTYIKQHGYTDSAGQKVSDADGHVLTGILGAQYTIGYTLSPSIAWYPELRAAITYDFMEPELENSVTLVNGSRYDVVTENLDKFGIEIGARVGLDINRKAEIALEYEGVFKGDYTNHTGLASLRYKF